ncbi:MAG: DUF1501 domain-containing protein [Pirellulaceae bacterium]|jgi:hypothetical protein|nr:DUF1501 domain-containing protein [Pirellulaceae bacterium]|tara:strand:+ start:28 stop:1530 length:1503 start_codon:yes stop_codon:yes gene_type:complete
MNIQDNPLMIEQAKLANRRQFFGSAATGIGGMALASLLNPTLFDSTIQAQERGVPAIQPGAAGILQQQHFPAKAKRIIYLFMSGAPSQLDMFDYKPGLVDMFDKDLPDSVRNGQRITTMTSGQSRLAVAPSKFKFAQHGENGTWFSELLPHMASVADDIAVIKTVNTEAINHDPAITYITTGSQIPGRPSLGAWLSYGLGSANRDLPCFVVLHSTWSAKRDAQALYERLWGSGFMSTQHAGVALRSQGDPVLYLSNPTGMQRKTRRRMLDALQQLNAERRSVVGDPQIDDRIAQYEMAYRMQMSIPELTDISRETKDVLQLYGDDVTKPGTFAANCLLARRLAERDVKFVQVFIRGWDQHGNLPGDITSMCQDVDQGAAALIKDLKQRDMLKDTLVVWGGEFGRTVYCQGGLTKDNYGRDHHPRNYCVWLAGGGIQGGITYGETDDFSYNVTENPVHIHDLNATLLHQLGVDHEKLTYRFQGRDFRLTDIHGKVVQGVLA